MIIIDGSYHEGGGQIIRTSFSLAAITQQAIKIEHIRARRDKPGLAAQHLTACLAVNEITQGKLIGAELRSQALQFEPGRIQSGEFHFNIGTAGSAILVAQTILPVLLTAQRDSTVIIEGGTHLRKSPSVDYFQTVFLPALQRFGINITFKLERCGFYPRGGGKIILHIHPQTWHGNSDWQGNSTPRALIRLFRLAEHIGLREKRILNENGIKAVDIFESQDSYSPGNSLMIWRDYGGTTNLGEIGKPAETVAQEAVDEFKQEQGQVDKYLADQLLLYAALAKGLSAYTTSLFSDHLLTNAYVIKQFVNRNITFKDNLVNIS